MSSEYNQVLIFSARHRAVIFLVGFACMVLSGYFLVIGLSQFAVNESVKVILAASAVTLQIAESACFMIAAAMPSPFKKIRAALFAGGSIIFIFSIAVVTVAQKAVFQESEVSANASDTMTKNIEGQIANLDATIASYRLNGEKQSRSIYPESRAKGQESLDKAAKLTEKQEALSAKLFDLQKQRSVTGMDVYHKLEKILGIDAENMELGFIVVRSLLLETIGVLFLSLPGYLKTLTPTAPENKPEKREPEEKPKKPEEPSKATPKTIMPAKPDNRITSINSRRPIKKPGKNKQYPERDILAMAEKMLILLDQGKIKSAGRDTVISALAEHHDIRIGAGPAMRVVEKVKELRSSQTTAQELEQ